MVRFDCGGKFFWPFAYRRAPRLSAVAGPPGRPPSAAVSAARPPEAISRWRIDVSSSKNNRRMKSKGKFSRFYTHPVTRMFWLLPSNSSSQACFDQSAPSLIFFLLLFFISAQIRYSNFTLVLEKCNSLVRVYMGN